MNRFSVLGAAALLAVLPTAVHAQSTPTSTSQEVIVERTTTVVVKEAPKPSPVTFTPYGFFLANAYFSDAPSARNYPTPVVCVGGDQCGGAFLIDVRQTRLGARLVFDDKAGWTGATLTGLVEIDFNGGYGVGANSTAGSNLTAGVSSAFYNPVVRLRKAYADASWGSEAKFTIRIGQDDRLVSPLRSLSLAYVANPLFQNAGLLHGRAPMAALRFDMAPKSGIAFNVAVAALDPMEQTQLGNVPATTGIPLAVDFGAGNRSRVPNFEGRVGVGFRSEGKKVAELGGWAGWQKNRFVNPANGQAFDQNTTIYGGDLTLNVWFVQAFGSIYKANGYEIPGALNSQGIGLTTTGSPGIPAGVNPPAPAIPSTLALTGTKAIPAFGGWFQVAVGPPSLFQVYGGWGGTQTPFSALAGTQLATATRFVQSYMWAAGAIGYAGKNWRFSAEYASDRSWAYSGQTYKVGQFSLNSQVVF